MSVFTTPATTTITLNLDRDQVHTLTHALIYSLVSNSMRRGQEGELSQDSEDFQYVLGELLHSLTGESAAA